MSKIQTIINIPFKDNLSEDILVSKIKSLEDFPDERIDILFTEVPIGDLIRWCIEKEIPFNTLKEYYNRFILEKGLRNKSLEEFFEL
jgi:hypothetical protein